MLTALKYPLILSSPLLANSVTGSQTIMQILPQTTYNLMVEAKGEECDHLLRSCSYVKVQQYNILKMDKCCKNNEMTRY